MILKVSPYPPVCYPPSSYVLLCLDTLPTTIRYFFLVAPLALSHAGLPWILSDHPSGHPNASQPPRPPIPPITLL